MRNATISQLQFCQNADDRALNSSRKHRAATVIAIGLAVFVLPSPASAQITNLECSDPTWTLFTISFDRATDPTDPYGAPDTDRAPYGGNLPVGTGDAITGQTVIGFDTTDPTSAVPQDTDPTSLATCTEAEMIRVRSDKTTLFDLFKDSLGNRSRPFVESLLTKPQIVRRGWVDGGWLQRELHSPFPWTNWGYPLWQCICLEMWLQHRWPD